MEIYKYGKYSIRLFNKSLLRVKRRPPAGNQIRKQNGTEKVAKLIPKWSQKGTEIVQMAYRRPPGDDFFAKGASLANTYLFTFCNK